MIPYARHSVTNDDIRAVVEVLRHGDLTGGAAVAAFEEEITRVTGAPHAIACSNGTSALRLMYQACGLTYDKAIAVPAITFIATASQAVDLGARVVLVDVDPDTLLMTPETVRAVRGRVDYVVPVHMAGRTADTYGIAEASGAIVLEDAAHAFGSGSFPRRSSMAASFSFHPSKNVTTGEGGAIVCEDERLAKRLRTYRNHGMIPGAHWMRQYVRVAGNHRLSDIQAALGASQAKRIDTIRTQRQDIVDYYRVCLQGIPWLTLPPDDRWPVCWHLFIVQINWGELGMSREVFFEKANAAGWQPQVHYKPLCLNTAYRDLAKADTLRGALQAYERIVSLPLYAELTLEDQDRVIGFLRSL